ncbi:MAG: hypothetical protein JST16_15560 [Bdellovibrionales bacterium]|nr:hypothetical protein [Bdellovibrionales bacterium]
MELSCPSCGVKHRTEDHRGAFEILCVCGYSILIPDEAALAEPVAEEAPSSPISMDAEDAALAVQPPLQQSDAPQALEMTPPDQLPSEMVYDPFELNPPPPPTESIPSPPMDHQSEGYSGGEATAAGTEMSFDAPPIAEAPPAPEAAPTPSQKLVERVQAASMGRLLGQSFDLKCSELSRDALVEVSKRCLRLMKDRPWLENELRSRGIDLETLADRPTLTDVPEIIALEIYLTCFELGGVCDLQRKT